MATERAVGEQKSSFAVMTASSGPRRAKSERPRSAGNLAPCVATRLRLPRRLRPPPRATRQYFRRSRLTLPRVRLPVQFLDPDVLCCLAYLTPTQIPLFDFRLLQSHNRRPHGGADEASAPTEALRLRQLRWLWAFVADRFYLAEQLRQRHARERLEQRRHLRRHLGDVAGDLVHAGSLAIPSGDDGDLVHVRQRTG